MKILVLGGTGWLGRRAAQVAIAAGHEVVCTSRGSEGPAGAQQVSLDRDADDALAALPATEWDAVVDVATHPGQVRRAVRDLGRRADRYVYVSTCDVYASLVDEGVDESAALNAPLSADKMTMAEQYGPAKVACEQAVLTAFGSGRSVILRPGLIGGPGDPTGRSTYWPSRFAHPSNPQGQVLVPDALDQLTSVIDVRDLADWIIRLVERDASGVFNATGNAIPLEQHLQAAREVAASTASFAPASPPWLTAHDVSEWMGPRSLPLWINDPAECGVGALSNARARAAGLTLCPLHDTLADTLAWAKRARVPTANGAGLTDADERSLLAELGAL